MLKRRAMALLQRTKGRQLFGTGFCLEPARVGRWTGWASGRVKLRRRSYREVDAIASTIEKNIRQSTKLFSVSFLWLRELGLEPRRKVSQREFLFRRRGIKEKRGDVSIRLRYEGREHSDAWSEMFFNRCVAGEKALLWR